MSDYIGELRHVLFPSNEDTLIAAMRDRLDRLEGLVDILLRHVSCDDDACRYCIELGGWADYLKETEELRREDRRCGITK